MLFKKSAKKKNSKNIVTTHTSVPKGFFDMTDEEQFAFAERLLRGLNPGTPSKPSK